MNPHNLFIFIYFHFHIFFLLFSQIVIVFLLSKTLLLSMKIALITYQLAVFIIVLLNLRGQATFLDQ